MESTDGCNQTEQPAAPDDEDLITCHVCLLRFNEANQKPKFLDCHHYFCIKCIQSFSETTSIECPTCRHITRLDNRQVKDLRTNNIVLRLVSIATDRAQEVIEQNKIKQKIHPTERCWENITKLNEKGEVKHFAFSRLWHLTLVYSIQRSRFKQVQLIELIKVEIAPT